MAREEEEAGASGLVAVAGEEEGERMGGAGRGLAPPLARIARSLTNRVMWSAQLVLSLGSSRMRGRRASCLCFIGLQGRLSRLYS
jgi:hypothetical protein